MIVILAAASSKIRAATNVDRIAGDPVHLVRGQDADHVTNVPRLGKLGRAR
jgi:hypothetical protein